MITLFNNNPIRCEHLNHNVEFRTWTAKMSKEAYDEMSVLSAIYCEQDEFELLEESSESLEFITLTLFLL